MKNLFLSVKQFQNVLSAPLLLPAALFFDLDFPDNLDASTIIWQKLDCWQVGCYYGNFQIKIKKKEKRKNRKKSIYKTQNGQTDYSLAGKPHPLKAVDQALPLAASLL